jgi:hypothetical protein
VTIEWRELHNEGSPDLVTKGKFGIGTWSWEGGNRNRNMGLRVEQILTRCLGLQKRKFRTKTCGYEGEIRNRNFGAARRKFSIETCGYKSEIRNQSLMCQVEISIRDLKL